jgi:hypothetical protein
MPEVLGACRRHKVGCSCTNSDMRVENELDELISSQWASELERQAVRRKFVVCGIHSVANLGKCILTPVWGNRILSDWQVLIKK